MTIFANEQEKKILLEALNMLQEKEVRNARFFEVGGIERGRCNRRLDIISTLKRQLNG